MRTIRTLRRGEEKEHLRLLNLCYGYWGDEALWRRRYNQPGFDPYSNVIVVEEDGKWVGGGTMWFRRASSMT